MKGIDTTYTRKVLIVDDEPHIVHVLKRKLENAGYEVITAVNGIDGLEKFVKEKPAVIISDINMPHLNGQEMYKMIQDHEQNDPFVILITSLVDGAIHKWAKEISNIHFMEKPFSPSNILCVINEYFSKQQETNATR